MKIGVFDDGTVDLRGGGFTFKSEVIKQLIQCEIKPDDQLVVFSWKKSSYLNPTCPKGIDAVCFKEPYGLKHICRIISVSKRLLSLELFADLWLAITQKKLDYIRKWISRGYRQTRRNIFENQIRSYGIDLAIYMEPSEVFTYKIPYICICWDLEHLYNPFFPETNFTSLDLTHKKKSISLKRAVHIITGTNVGKEQIHSQYRIPKNRISVLPFPTPVLLLSEKLDKISDLPAKFNPESAFVFYPASFWPHKNHYLLIRTIQVLVKNKNIDLDLVLCGTDKGNKGFVLKLIDQYQLNDNIFVFDFLSRGVINYLYSKALAMVFPTHLGPDNLPPLEAFALGCPVIASAVDGAEEQLGDDALLFDPFNADDLTDKILLLINNKSRRNELIEKGLQRSKQWTSKEYAQSVISLVEKYRPYNNCFDLKTYKVKFS